MRTLLSVALLALAACGDGRGDERGVASGRVDLGLPVPAYRTVSLSGDSVSLADHRGKVLLLNIWATWCHPCRDEIPELRAIYDKYRSRGLELVGVSVDVEGADDNVREFMKEFEMHYPVWLDPGERISTQFLVIGVPATFLIDRTGVLRWRRSGPIAPGDTTLAVAIEQALSVN